MDFGRINFDLFLRAWAPSTAVAISGAFGDRELFPEILSSLRYHRKILRKNSRKFFLSFQEGFLSRFTGPYACKSSISDRFQPVSAKFQAQFCIHAWIFWSLARTQDLMHALCMADRKRNGEQRARRMRAFLRHALFCYLFWGRIRIPDAILVLSKVLAGEQCAKIFQATPALRQIHSTIY